MHTHLRGLLRSNLTLEHQKQSPWRWSGSGVTPESLRLQLRSHSGVTPELLLLRSDSGVGVRALFLCSRVRLLRSNPPLFFPQHLCFFLFIAAKIIIFSHHHLKTYVHKLIIIIIIIYSSSSKNIRT